MDILIADSGSTKTDWAVCRQGKAVQRLQTAGINPVHLSPEEIARTVHEMVQALNEPESVGRIRFYGAGCKAPQMQAVVAEALHAALPRCPLSEVQIDTDLVGAAHALCQGKAGIACILGTGSNSCEFDGQRMVRNTPPLGYILGDEGSGATLGRILVGDCLKGQLPEALREEFFKEYGLTQEEFIERVYRQPLANRFLASFTPFLHKHRTEPVVHRLLVEEFIRFFRRNVQGYDTTLPVHFTGSIAFHFRKEVGEAAHALGLTTGRFLQSPMEGLVEIFG